MVQLERRLKQETNSSVIDPKILGILWNELPAGSHENYKLKYHRGEALAQSAPLPDGAAP